MSPHSTDSNSQEQLTLENQLCIAKKKKKKKVLIVSTAEQRIDVQVDKKRA